MHHVIIQFSFPVVRTIDITSFFIILLITLPCCVVNVFYAARNVSPECFYQCWWEGKSVLVHTCKASISGDERLERNTKYVMVTSAEITLTIISNKHFQTCMQIIRQCQGQVRETNQFCLSYNFFLHILYIGQELNKKEEKFVLSPLFKKYIVKELL